MIQRPTIPHFKPQIVDNEILGGQGGGSLKRLPHPLFLKSTLFTNSGRGKPLIMPRPSSSGISMSIIRTFKLGIIGFCYGCNKQIFFTSKTSTRRANKAMK